MTSGPDIILGVSRAADAVKQREAVARLEKLSRQAGVDVAATTTSTEPTANWSTELRKAATAPSSRTAVPTPPSETEASGKTPDVYVQFEAVLLQTMVEAMMPQDSESMFGGGTAGSMWKSMMAEKVAGEIARSGAVGIAKQVASGEAARSAAAAAAAHKTKVGEA